MTRVKRLSQLSLLTAFSLCVYIIEAQLPPLTAIPGIKLGLSNIFTVVTFHLLGPIAALSQLVVRILLGNLITGHITSIGFSLSGGILAYLILFTLQKIPQNQLWAVSMLSAVMHNIGQLLLAAFVVGSGAVFWYFPILLLSALASGLLTGLTALYVLRKLMKNKAIINPIAKEQEMNSNGF